MSELDEALEREVERRKAVQRERDEAHARQRAVTASQAVHLKPMAEEFLGRMRARGNPGAISNAVHLPRRFGQSKYLSGWRLAGPRLLGRSNVSTYYLLTDGRWVCQPFTYTTHPSFLVVDVSEVDAPIEEIRDAIVQLLADNHA
jgi:hypothetical protein